MKENAKRAWDFWNQFGPSPICLAPMAEVNDLAFRILCRRHNVKVCYTGMLNSIQWSQGRKYQNRVFNTCEEDRPLIAQLAGSDYDTIFTSAKDLSQVCDAIDVNLGCTQHIARRGGYGFFMVDTPEKRAEVLKLFKKLSENVDVPITAKIRIFTKETEETTDQDKEAESIQIPDIEGTIDFAKKLEEAGVSVIAVHGRYQHRNKKADVSTDIIKKVVEAVKIPVIANGGVNSAEDAASLLKETNAAGIMVGQALLVNPTLFDPSGPLKRKDFAKEYLEIAKKHPEINIFYPRKHMFKFYESAIKESPGIETKIKEATTIDDLIAFVDEIEKE
ncbi:hypothetical protein M9Y10_014728 [Tritrichomonas musculus]|uniref:tRNA-dihydrouridine synthase n=1 Tax=Tritrichomonas musculus TaxID=1915356 RepID=A0ABR2L256_9EUKA